MKTFAGIPEEFAREETSAIALQFVPYDGTSTWNKGADKGPEAFSEAAENMELYDIMTDTEVYRQGIWKPDVLENFQSPEEMAEAVYQRISYLLKRGKYVTMFGGEHSISIGSIRAFKDHWKKKNNTKISVLQIDAHADLRKEYQGSTYNHACALYEASQTTNLVQVGIRSMDISEKDVMKKDHVLFAHQIDVNNNWIDAIDNLLTKQVYLTIDLDAFSPGIMPSTGTPEPGGFDYYQIINLVQDLVKTKNIIGFDIVELCPSPYNPAPNLFAAKLYYQILSLIFKYKSHGL